MISYASSQTAPRTVLGSRVFAACCLALACALTASAQTPPPSLDPAAQAAERLQREEQDRQREQLRRATEAARPALGVDAAAAMPAVAAPRDTVRREITRLTINGGDHLTASFRAALAARFTNCSMGVQELEQLLTEITRHYILRGFVTSRVYVPDQDLASGELILRVVEGRLERLEPAGLAGNIFPVHPGEPLNLRDLEQGIDNLNRLASHHAVLDMLPGTAPGDTIVAIRDTRTRPWRLALSADNTGSEGTGRDQASATLSVDDLLGFGEGASLTHRRAVPYQAGRRASESTSGSLSVPWGWQMLTLGGSASSYALLFAAPSGLDLPFNGTSRSAYLRTDRVVYRSQSARVSLYSNLAWKSSRNRLLGSLISVSSRDAAAFDLGATGSRPLFGGLASLDLSISRGLAIFGASSDPRGLPAYAPHGEFTAFKLSGNWSRSFALGGLDFTYTSALNAQSAPNVLYGADQLTVGGLYAVRGFDRTSLAGDRGYVWRNDLSLSLPLSRGPSGAARVTLRPYLGLDQGYAWSNITGLPGFTPAEGSLIGGAVGLGLSAGRFSADVSGAKSLDHPSSLTRENGRFYVRFNVSF
jgi:hemolysin activation/secretion protein